MHSIVLLVRRLIMLSMLFCAPALAAPLAAPDIVSYTVTDLSVTLTWDRTPAIKGKTTYTVRYCVSGGSVSCLPTVSGAVTKGVEATVDGLTPDTVHYFQVYASDSGGNEASGNIEGPLTTCSVGETCDGSGSGGSDGGATDGGGTDGGSTDGGGTDGGGDPGGSCDYPTFREPFLDGNLTLFVKPDWAVQSTNTVFDDGFAEGEPTESWIIGDMLDPLSQAGNEGIDENGFACSGCRPRGKRWSAWYDRNWELTIEGYSSERAEGDASNLFRVTGLGGGVDGALSLGGHVESGEIDPTRPGTGVPWYVNRLYGSWLKTWARDPVSRDIESGQNVAGKDKWTAPMYLETRVNFEQMTTPGFRFSMWLMPATYLDGRLATGSEAYDGRFANGFEIDVFEYEPWKPNCKELMEFSWLNSFATKGRRGAEANGRAHLRGSDGHYPSPATGWHTVGLLWEQDRLQWVYDGYVVLEIADPAKIPDIYQYLILSRELVNGRITGNAVYDGSGYFLPPEGGLYGYEGGSNLGDHVERVDTDEVWIDYVRIYKPAP